MNCLVFKISGSLYAVDAGAVVGVENQLNINSLPGQPDFIVGIAQVRGKMTPVVNVHRYFGQASKAEGTVLVVSSEHGQIAYLTDGVETIREIDFNNNNEAPLIIKSFAGCVKNMSLMDGQPVIFIDLPDILLDDQKERLIAYMKQIDNSGEDKEEQENREEPAQDASGDGE